MTLFARSADRCHVPNFSFKFQLYGRRRMVQEFLESNRTELIERCRAKVALRPGPRAPSKGMEHGIPMFLQQLIETLRIAGSIESPAGHERSAAAGPTDQRESPELAATAAKHGHELLQHGYTVDQVVHDYGDMCQAVTELAIEREATVTADEFKTLNMCLDNAIAAAVSEYDRERDHLVLDSGNRAMSERLGFLAHELRNSLSTAMLSVAVIKRGDVGMSGATAGVLDRSLVAMRNLIDRTLTDVRLGSGVLMQVEDVAVNRFIGQVQVAANLEARVKGCEFTVFPIDSGLRIQVDRQLLSSALANLLQPATGTLQ